MFPMEQKVGVGEWLSGRVWNKMGSSRGTQSWVFEDPLERKGRKRRTHMDQEQDRTTASSPLSIKRRPSTGHLVKNLFNKKTY